MGLGKRTSQFADIMEHFIPIHAENNIGDYPAHTLIGALTEHLGGRFPLEMNQLLEIHIVIIPAQNNITASWTISYASLGEDKDTHTDLGNVNVVAVNDAIHHIPLIADFPDANPGDYFGITVTGNAGDTLYIIGTLLRYR